MNGLKSFLSIILFYICKNKEFLTDKKAKRILLAPLDWGLGHSSRCVPLIRYLTASGHDVWFAGTESQQEYIRSVFPGLPCLFLEGYNVRYAASRYAFMPKLLSQLPRIRSVISREQEWLDNAITTHHIDAVISDNRYGLYSSKVPCVFVTHQLRVLSGLGTIADRLLREVHYRLIVRFNTCWVVDTAAAPGLSGSMGHPGRLPAIPVQYLGLLSQCAGTVKSVAMTPYILVLLSGAEPQRSMLSAMLWRQVQALRQKVVFVEGSDTAAIPQVIPAHIRHYSRVSGQALQDLIAAAELVICRSGYSSLMDLAALQQKAILVPTPGQTEQEYLARQLHRNGQQMAAAQQGFDLDIQLAKVGAFPYNPMPADFSRYAQVLDQWLEQL